MKRTIFYPLVFASGCLLCVSCGGSVSISTTPSSRVRAMNDFVDAAAVSATVGGTPLLNSQPFAFTSLFEKVKSGTQAISFFDAPTQALLATRSATLNTGSFYEAIGLGSAAKGRHILFMSADQVALPGQTKVRLINGDEDALSLDIYVTPAGTTDLTGLTPQRAAAEYADDTAAYVANPPGSYTIWFTPPGQPSTRLIGANETFTQNTNLTLLLLKGPSGLIVQQITDNAS